ncbi:iron-sulfur cluster assembly scaffold protein [Caulobacter henricii]|uniref:Nitrogen fixation protein NifU n=1 Tax=Caulobacter henricii TaxID=69395 RepID=A0A0P0NW86_9CAUL|nr:iron-sulfur cluster assembly scaffold protein [Caulobacter henricii]ALL12287.1 nitrogen fixation protein NifU [Caulobacter henricii]
MIDALYSARILTLVANIPYAGRLAAPDASSEKTAKLCGSRIVVDVVMVDGKVSQFAQEVAACALGQASAAILGAHIIGADLAEIELARDSLRAMLKLSGPAPEGRFSELAVLEPVKAYPARHASTLLAFEAAAEAVSRATAVAERRTSSAGAA